MGAFLRLANSLVREIRAHVLGQSSNSPHAYQCIYGDGAHHTGNRPTPQRRLEIPVRTICQQTKD